MCACESESEVWQRWVSKRKLVERGAQALTDGHVITARKSMLLDLGLPHTFIGLAAGRADVDRNTRYMWTRRLISQLRDRGK